MSRFRTIAFISIFLYSALSKCQHLQCQVLFDRRASAKIGISLTYSPSLRIDGRSQSFPSHVFIETYDIGERVPFGQYLKPYINKSTGLSEPFGRNNFHNLGLDAIYQNYGTIVPAETIELVKKVEISLPIDRQATFQVNSVADFGDTNGVVGFMRVFDGSIHSFSPRAESSPALPLEKILRFQKKKTSIVNEKRSEGAEVFEVGKYFLHKNLNAEEMILVRKSILLWLIDFLESRSETLNTSFFFVHVASRVHQRAYKEYYGFQNVMREKSVGLELNENIMVLSGTELLANLRKITF